MADLVHAPLKIVISGPVGAGKTSLIRCLSDVPVVNTDELSSEAIGKSLTTVALDFGRLQLGSHCLHLFGTPGQERFHFMWDVLSEGAFGLILLLPAHRPQHFSHARAILESITSRHALPFIIATTHADLGADAWGVDDVAGYFDLPPRQVIAIHAEQPASARQALRRLLELLCEPEAAMGEPRKTKEEPSHESTRTTSNRAGSA